MMVVLSGIDRGTTVFGIVSNLGGKTRRSGTLEKY
jgi:hypothetical protein